MSHILFSCIAALRAKVGVSILLAGCIVAFSCSRAAAAEKNQFPTTVADARDILLVETADREFAIDFYHQLANEHPGENLFFSPLSLSSALLIATEGASGETAEQMGNILHVPAALRSTDRDAATAPWRLGPMHLGQSAINNRLTPTRTTPQIRQKIAQLRRNLKAANERASHPSNPTDGAKARDTAFRLASQLNALIMSTSGYEWVSTNALWGERTFPFHRPYVESIRSYYGGVLYPVDFRMQTETTRRQINSWVARQTANRIQELLAPGSVSSDTHLVITNSVYFKGEWLEPFQASDTQARDFHLAQGKKIPTKMMYQETSDSAGYAAFNGDGSLFITPQRIDSDISDNDPSLYPDSRGFTMLELPYKGDKLSMVVIVPQSADGLADLETKLTGNSLKDWIGRIEQRSAHVYLPKFKLDAKYSLNKPLKSMGMIRAFVAPGEAGGAQFDRMAVGNSISISDVFQQTFVDVDEKGTEAAAVTAMICASPTSAGPSRMRPLIPTFLADKPFLFAICDKESHNILFLGRMLTPPAPAR